jgi:hypothetical protein
MLCGLFQGSVIIFLILWPGDAEYFGQMYKSTTYGVTFIEIRVLGKFSIFNFLPTKDFVCSMCLLLQKEALSHVEKLEKG